MRAGPDLPPVLDLEDSGGLGPGDLVAWTQTWLNEVERLTGRTPMLYTGYYFWQDHLGSTTSLTAESALPAVVDRRPVGGPHPAAVGHVDVLAVVERRERPGIPATVDLDRFCCADGNLAALAVPGSAAAGNPFGNVDILQSQPGGVGVYGWAIDPDSTGPVQVHVYVDYTFAGLTTANGARSDLVGAYPGWGPGHGFALAVPAGPGVHWVCAYAINVATGTENSSLGCHWVSPQPIGSLDGGTSRPGSIRVTGWAIAPDTNAAADVDFYVNGAMVGHVKATGNRPDVGAAFPNYGPNHGYDVVLPGSGGVVCAYAIATSTNTPNTRLGCRYVLPTPMGSLDAGKLAGRWDAGAGLGDRARHDRSRQRRLLRQRGDARTGRCVGQPARRRRRVPRLRSEPRVRRRAARACTAPCARTGSRTSDRTACSAARPSDGHAARRTPGLQGVAGQLGVAVEHAHRLEGDLAVIAVDPRELLQELVRDGDHRTADLGGLHHVQDLARARPEELEVRVRREHLERAAHERNRIGARVGDAAREHRHVRVGAARQRAGDDLDLVDRRAAR